jgi:hypothetical protein
MINRIEIGWQEKSGGPRLLSRVMVFRMIAGLKSYLPRLAEIVGSTPAALYERQRALTRLGLLTALAGRGPGSGVQLSADCLAAMVISLLATENLSDIDKRMVRLCNARPLPGPACAITGAKTFRQAVTTLFTDPSFSREGDRLIGFSVERYQGAHIGFFEHGTKARFTRFEVAAEKSRPTQLITRQASVSTELIRIVVDDLSALLPAAPFDDKSRKGKP